MSDTISIGFRIPKNKVPVWQEFLAILEAEYGKKKGIVSAVIIKLVEDFVKKYKEQGGIDPLLQASHTHTTMHLHPLSVQNPVKRRYKSLNTSKILAEVQEIKDELLSRFPVGSRLGKIIIMNIIREKSGVFDKRSLQVRFNELLRQRVIMPADLKGEIYELSLVNSSGNDDSNRSYKEEQSEQGFAQL